MNRKKSKIASLLAVFGLAVIMTGCSQDEVVDQPVLSGGNEIAFRVSDARPNSALRASVTTMQNLNNFTLTGIKREGGNLLLDGVTVTRSANGADWEYFPKAAWPEKTKMVDFYAFSPANSLNVSSGFKGKTDHTLVYTVPTSANEQEDFLVTVQEKAADPTDNIVKLNFKHALSRVLVNARAATSLTGVNVVVKSVTFKNLAKRGTLALEKDDPQPAGNPAKEISFGWPLDHEILKYAAYTNAELETGGFTPAYTRIWEPDMTAKADYPLDMRGENGIKISNDGHTYTALTGDMSALMVMPQQTTWATESSKTPTDADNDFYIDIQYTVNNKSYNAKKRVKDYWKRSEGSFCFEPGKAYEFNLVIGLSVDGGQNPAGSVEVVVNSVNDWYTKPDGIDVDRRLAPGDLYDYNGPDGAARYVHETDERGRVTMLKYSYRIYTELVTKITKYANDNGYKQGGAKAGQATELCAALIAQIDPKLFDVSQITTQGALTLERVWLDSKDGNNLWLCMEVSGSPLPMADNTFYAWCWNTFGSQSENWRYSADDDSYYSWTTVSNPDDIRKPIIIDAMSQFENAIYEKP